MPEIIFDPELLKAIEAEVAERIAAGLDPDVTARVSLSIKVRPRISVSITQDAQSDSFSMTSEGLTDDDWETILNSPRLSDLHKKRIKIIRNSGNDFTDDMLFADEPFTIDTVCASINSALQKAGLPYVIHSLIRGETKHLVKRQL